MNFHKVLGIVAVAYIARVIYRITALGDTSPFTWFLCAALVFAFYLGVVRRRAPMRASTVWDYVVLASVVGTYALMEFATSELAMTVSMMLTAVAVVAALLSVREQRRRASVSQGTSRLGSGSRAHHRD